MTLVRQRARIARVRKLQHDLAALAVTQANGHVQQLVLSRERLGSMRDVLTPQEGATLGADLASRGELAMRLDQARNGLTPTIANARANVERREIARLGARVKFESARKLEAKAIQSAEEADERRRMASHRPRDRAASGETA